MKRESLNLMLGSNETGEQWYPTSFLCVVPIESNLAISSFKEDLFYPLVCAFTNQVNSCYKSFLFCLILPYSEFGKLFQIPRKGNQKV